jgi:hypothetical protein
MEPPVLQSRIKRKRGRHRAARSHWNMMKIIAGMTGIYPYRVPDSE